MHAVGALLLHALRDMTVDVERKGSRCVTNIMLDSFDIVAILQGQHSIGVPLWYIKDKTGKTLKIKVLRLSGGFSSFSKPRKQV